MHYFSKIKSEVEVILKTLSIDMPGAEFSEAYRYHNWDGKVKYYDKYSNTFSVGLLQRVLKSINKIKIKYTLSNFDDRDVSWVKFSVPFLSSERDYQRNSILEFLKRGYGIIKVPTRGGKTFIAAEIIRLLQNKTPNSIILFLADSADVFKQNINDISKVLGIEKDEIGQIRGSDIVYKNINVAMVQTLQSHFKNKKGDYKQYKRRKNIIKFLESVNTLIIDEVHEYGESKPRRTIIKKCKNVNNILSLSGTPKKSSLIATMNVEDLTGGIVYEIEESELVDRKVLADNRILLLLINHPTLFGNQTYQTLQKKLIIKNYTRNEILKNMLIICDALFLKTLVIFSSKEHGRKMSNLTGYNFIHGDTKESERESEKLKFLKEKGGVLFASHIWKKGITLPEVDVLLNASGGKEESMILQIRGRVLGATAKKKRALYIDFVDNCDEYFNEHSLERIRAYESKIGMDKIDVLDTESSDFYNDAEDYLIEWFNIDSIENE